MIGRIRIIWVVLGSFLLGSVSAQQPNVLIIIADDMGVDATTSYGISNRTANTPHLDSLRANGLMFVNAWAYGSCSPSRAALLTGKFGIKTGVTNVPADLDTSHVSLFRAVEQRTQQQIPMALVGKWHLSQPTNQYDDPLLHGVDEFMGVMTGGVDDYYAWARVENGQETIDSSYVTIVLTDYAIDWIDQQTQPWLLWLAHPAPHSPLHIPPDSLYTQTSVTNNRLQYRAMIEAMDHEIGRLFDHMTPAEKANTLVFFVGDNGTPRNLLQAYPDGQAKGSVYEGGVRVPLFVSGKGVSRIGEVDSSLVHIADIHATVLEAYDSTISEVGGVFNSLSFHHLLDGNPANRPTRPYNYSELAPTPQSTTNVYAIREARYKLIVDIENNTEAFYDLITDPLEVSDLMLVGLSPAQQAIKADMEAEAAIIRSGWSCNDFIQNGSETGIDCIGSPCQSCARIALSKDATWQNPPPVVYPNPTDGAIQLRITPAWRDAKLRILDVQGRTLRELTLGKELAYSLDLELTQGVYVLRVERGEGDTYQTKLITYR